MDLLTVLSAILAGEIGLVSFIISTKTSKKIESYFNDINIEVAPNLKKLPNKEIIDFQEIQNFITKMLECSYFNKDKLLNDLQSITIKGINPILYIFKYLGLGGSFIPSKNRIEYANISKLKELIINHELIHLSTYFESEEVIYCGFQQIRADKKIGTGINEAMDMYLLQKYFNQNNKNAYGKETMLFNKLTEIIPSDILEKHYFDMDLLGLVNYLENYDDKLNIIKFIRSFDFIVECGEYAAMFKDRKFNEIILFISQCLIKWCIFSSYQNTINNRKDEDEYLNQITKYIESLDFHYKLLWKDFAALNNDVLNNSINESEIPLSTKTKLLEKVLKKIITKLYSYFFIFLYLNYQIL